MSNLQLYVIVKLIENRCYPEFETLHTDTFYGYSPSCNRDVGVGPSTQTLVSTQTSNYVNITCPNDPVGDNNSEDDDYEEKEEDTDVDTMLDDVDDEYQEGSSVSDVDLGEGDDGPIFDDDVETHLVHYEVSKNRRYERVDYPFYSDIGCSARQEEGLIDYHNEHPVFQFGI